MYKEKFIKLAGGLEREGAKEVLDYLETTDFFQAPASNRYHGDYEGGLVEHSVNVALDLQVMTIKNNLQWQDDESPYIIGLFHDICKIDFYSTQMRNVKDANGVWTQKPFYVIDDRYPMGHGEKSLYLLTRYMRLTDEEAMCIRWHMGAYEPKESYMALSAAKTNYPNILWTHLADDLEASQTMALRAAV